MLLHLMGLGVADDAVVTAADLRRAAVRYPARPARHRPRHLPRGRGRSERLAARPDDPRELEWRLVPVSARDAVERHRDRSVGPTSMPAGRLRRARVPHDADIYVADPDAWMPRHVCGTRRGWAIRPIGRIAPELRFLW